MSSKLTKLTESSTSVPPPSVLCSSHMFSQLSSPWSMALSGHFDPSQTYDRYKSVEFLDPACTECLKKENSASSLIIPGILSAITVLLGRNLVNIHGFQFPMSGGICGARRMVLLGQTSQLLRLLPLMVLQGIPARIRRTSNSPIDPNAEGSDELDGEEAEAAPNSIGHQSSTSPSQPSSKGFQSQVIPSTPRNSQPVLFTIPSSITPPSTARPGLV
ncbi:hypothetical protein O181_103036 [Austropuccinia psidii MF-1]|uniref:Uncharacterized protein n=1 Tax=Austropuccinia psidii MF-1 TaxID=1389203 RepID=A0A9Q3JJV4_9BASI|nr:hypothetical protein [Austropuccinia psidii MF-1]